MARPKRILIVGGGGREHAMAWRLARDENPAALFAAPGNPGIARFATCIPVQATDIPTLMAFAQGEGIDLTVVGPEAPLMAGLVDRFTAAGLRAVGPVAAAARLEGSKAFAKQLCRTHDIPSPEFRVFTAFDKARAYIEASQGGLVVKADGLCAGKGVFVCEGVADALQAAERLLVAGELGAAGRTIVVEDRIKGEELSVFAFTDGEAIYRFAEARDHKRLLDADQGPNTGGMGAFSPVPGLGEDLLERIDREILVPIVHALRVEGTPYRGILYAGLMITPGGPKVLEFNVRFGDPETQVVLPRLGGDFTAVLAATASGGLGQFEVRGTGEAAVTVVAAAAGYPDAPRAGDEITGLDALEGRDGVLAFHAGTALKGGRLVTAGGRVLAVTGLGRDIAAAKAAAYGALESVRFEGMQYRRDIAASALRAAGAPRG